MDVVQILKKLGFDAVKAQEAARLSWGRPGLAIDLAREEEISKAFKNELLRWEKIKEKSFSKKVKIFKDLFEGKDDAVIVRNNFQKSIDIWMVFWREKMLKKIEERNGEAKKIQSLIDGLKQAKNFLEMNANPKLLIENLILTHS